jgi:hypothetical protein
VKITSPISLYGVQLNQARGGEYFEKQLLVLAAGRQPNQGGPERTEGLELNVASPLMAISSRHYPGGSVT